MSTKLCKICNTREPHGYVSGTGEFLKDTCLQCFRRPLNRTNFIEGGDSKRSSKLRVPGKEDK